MKRSSLSFDTKAFIAPVVILIIAMTAACSKGSGNKRSDTLIQADSIMEQAYGYYNKADFNTSINLARNAVGTFLAENDSIALSDALSHLSACYQRIGMNDSALSNCFAGLRIDEKINDKNRLSSSYNNLAAIYLGIEHPVEAKPFIIKAIKLEQSIKPTRPSKLSIRYGVAAEIYLKLNKTDSALNYINLSLAIDSAAADTLHMARRLTVMGDIYSSMEKSNEALESYNSAIALLDSTADKYSLAITYKNLGSFYSKIGQHAKSLECLEKSTTLAEKCNARRILQLNYYNMGISPALASHDKAVEYLKLSSALKDTIYNDATSDITAHYNMKLESQHKQITIEEQQHSITKQRLIIIVTSVGMLLLLLGCATLFWFNLLKTRAQRAEKNAERMKDLFFTNMTHEFRTPLTVILGEADNLRAKETNAALLPQYNAIINQGNHMLTLVNQLLSISKVRSSIGSLEWQHGDLSMMVEMIVESMRIKAKAQDHIDEHDITIDLKSDNQDYNIDFVPEYCHSIITNLLANAIKFTPPGGKITVQLQRAGSKVILTISDTGVGIKPEDLPHIFELFYQGDNIHATVGTGIGLALVKQMTEAMNGEIHVESQANAGSTFTVTIPAKHAGGDYPQWVPKILTQQFSQDDDILLSSITTSDNTNAVAINDNDKPIVLIVEDNSDVAAYIEHVIEDSYCVVKASNGSDGVAQARELVPDIIITDIMMPGSTGYDLCREVRADELLSHIPIVVVTARSSSKDRLEAITAGADAFLVKPFIADELKALVEALLASRRLLRNKFQLDLNLNDPAPKVPAAVTTSENVALSASMVARDAAFIEKVKKLIAVDIENPNMNSSLIASKMNLSQRQLNRKVKGLIGIDTANLIRQIRVDCAKRMLCSTDIPVTEIAEKCGFDSASYFSKIFKQYTNLTPSAFRKAFAQ